MALHEPMKNEERWEIADIYLQAAWKIGFEAGWHAKKHFHKTSAEVKDNLRPSEGLYAGSNPAPTTT